MATLHPATTRLQPPQTKKSFRFNNTGNTPPHSPSVVRGAEASVEPHFPTIPRRAITIHRRPQQSIGTQPWCQIEELRPALPPFASTMSSLNSASVRENECLSSLNTRVDWALLDIQVMSSVNKLCSPTIRHPYAAHHNRTTTTRVKCISVGVLE
ncbi:hypothetical protein BD410DRAFT_806473 [Rickenella mellea]|uniref:Uncharacterized protein n=1 Tax=Rickenella mellea TaxID=50990 RepID=A0A4Y7PTP5_9AGAM|nr:hypothetical protein BD410DRAFT_809869 [Rickenella mellea]TDL18448.1 hypothetical protein BD410DRAFT_806473 [Rickenella mellea]